MDGYNQYPSMMGIPELRQAIAAHYGRWHGLNLDPMTEVIGHVRWHRSADIGDSRRRRAGRRGCGVSTVYDSYLPIIRQAGGIPRLVRLEPPHWRLTEEMLRSVFNYRTKAVLFNNPLNPARWSIRAKTRTAGAVLARSSIPSRSATKSGSTWIFDGREHIPLIGDPGHARSHRQRSAPPARFFR